MSVPAKPTVRIMWGLIGAAENAHLLPASTPDCVIALQLEGFDVAVPEHGPEQLARTKSPVWLAPVIEVAQDVSVTILVNILGAVVMNRVKARKKTALPVQQPLRLRIVRIGTDGSRVVHELEGTAEEVGRQAKEIDDAG
jgi:predicted peroxiredoxin